MEKTIDYKVNRYFFLAIILAMGIFILYSLIQFFTAFLSAIIFYVLSKPVTNYLLKKRRWKKGKIALLVIVVSFFVILMPISLLITLLYSKISSAAANPQIIIEKIKHVGDYVNNQFGVQIISDANLETVKGYATSILSSLLNQSFSFFTTIIMMYFFLYFMIKNSGRMEAAIRLYLPFNSEKIKIFGNELVAQTFSNAVGIPLIAVAQGICGYLSFLIAGLDEPAFWGVICGFSSVIPVVGTGIVWAPVAMYLLITDNVWQGIFVALWGLLVLGTIDNVIRFLLAKRMADVHPIVTVLGVILGLNYFGITGLIYGPLLISFFIILLRIYYTEYQKPKMTRPVKARQLVPSYMQPFLGVKKAKK